jgi:hypothetical protein
MFDNIFDIFLTIFWTYIFIFFAQSSHAEIDFLTTLIYRLLKLTFLIKPLSTMLKLAFLTTPPINSPNPVATGLRTIQFLFLLLT